MISVNDKFKFFFWKEDQILFDVYKAGVEQDIGDQHADVYGGSL